jgi:hypothetical protein
MRNGMQKTAPRLAREILQEDGAGDAGSQLARAPDPDQGP